MADAAVGLDQYCAESRDDAGTSGTDYLFDLRLLFANLCDNRIFQCTETVCRTAKPNQK